VQSNAIYTDGGSSATEDDVMTDDDGLPPIREAEIPVSALVDGEFKPRAVWYLREQGYGYKSIADVFDIEIQTARQYVSDVKKKRR
jgi:hypothetical protein